MREFNFVAWGADSYKVSHPSLYPKGTQRAYIYAEARKGSKWNEVVFFGLQYWLQEYLRGVVVTPEKIYEAKVLLAKHFQNPDVFEAYRWEHIIREHGGRLPISIMAVPEGTVISPNNVLYTVENTCSDCYWLPGYCDTLLTQLWGPIAVATQSRTMKRLLKSSLEKTSDNQAGLDFMLHDFGYRGSVGVEYAAITGAAHLVNFQGTDTLPALALLQDYYGAGVAGYSVPATEHTVTITHGRDGELELLEQVLQRFPDGIVSVVIDSYDTEACVRDLIGGRLADRIRERKGKVVVRPDSGDPNVVIPTVLNILGESFGYLLNRKGYKVLPSFIGVIQGDHVYADTLGEMLYSITVAGWSVENVVFGCGGGLRRVERNDLDFAMKCSEVTIGNATHKVSKKPITDLGKSSKEGRLALIRDENREFKTVPQYLQSPSDDFLKEVFRDGEVLSYPSFNQIRLRAAV